MQQILDIPGVDQAPVVVVTLVMSVIGVEEIVGIVDDVSAVVRAVVGVGLIVVGYTVVSSVA